MMKALLAALVVTAVQVCATRRTPPFSLNRIVACGLDAEDEKPSVVPFIKIEPNELDEVWLPESIAVDPPRGIIHYQLLEEEYMKLYGMGFNSSLSAVVIPPGEMGAIPYKLSRTPNAAPLFDPRFEVPGFETFVDNAAEFARLNGLGRCDDEIEFTWVKLPDYYYPPFVLSGRCTSTTPSCAFPPDAGYKCTPDTEDMQFVDVLRWDCCYVMIDRWWMRRCGWRHVRVPTIIHCTCDCSGVSPDAVV